MTPTQLTVKEAIEQGYTRFCRDHDEQCFKIKDIEDMPDFLLQDEEAKPKCPGCGAGVFSLSGRCPNCGKLLDEPTAPIQ